MPMLQGRCVGGSTLVNSAIMWRTPEDVIEQWRRDFGLGELVTMKALEPHFDALDRDLNAHEVTDDTLGENNRLFLKTAADRGIVATRMRRYERGCKGTGQCLTGCPSGAKQGMSVSYVPWALRTGNARLFCSSRVERVDFQWGGRAVGVTARAAGRRVTLRARYGVIVAASTVQTPNLLRRSGLRARDRPTLSIRAGCGGFFDRPIRMDIGATQGAESIAFRATDRSSSRRSACLRRPPRGSPSSSEFSRRLAQFGTSASGWRTSG